jgi:DNA excision repair protein ERCC-4
VSRKQWASFIIAIDEREKMPFDFTAIGTPCVRKRLPTGDYSILGLEHRVCIERKRPSELFTNFTTQRERFEREYERMATFDYAAVVVEGDLATCAQEGSRFSRVQPGTVINSLISWSIRYGVYTWFAGSRVYAQTLTWRLLEKFFMHKA